MTPEDKRRQRRKEKRVAQQPQLTAEQKAIVDAFEELDNAIKAVNKNFGRLAFVVDQQMLKMAGMPTSPAERKLAAVPDEEPSPEETIAAAEKALGEKIELN